MGKKCEKWYGVSHNFSKWTVKNEGRITNNETKLVVGSYLVQERKCEDCGFVEIKEQVVYSV